jgi:hypothetical protein
LWLWRLWVQTPLSTQIDWIKYLNEIQIEKHDLNNHKFNLFKNIEVSNIFGKKEFNNFFFENLYINFDNIFLKNKYKNLKNLIYFYLFYFNKINKSKLNFFNKKKIFLYNIININLKKKNIKFNFLQNNKNILTISPGIIYKQLNMDSKKSKKSFKLLNLMVKLFLKKISRLLIYKKFIINLNFLRKDIFIVLKLLKKYIKFQNVIFIYSFKKNNNFKFKKKKSIKKKLTKKFKNI